MLLSIDRSKESLSNLCAVATVVHVVAGQRKLHDHVSLFAVRQDERSLVWVQRDWVRSVWIPTKCARH